MRRVLVAVCLLALICCAAVQWRTEGGQERYGGWSRAPLADSAKSGEWDNNIYVLWEVHITNKYDTTYVWKVYHFTGGN